MQGLSVIEFAAPQGGNLPVDGQTLSHASALGVLRREPQYKVCLRTTSLMHHQIHTSARSHGMQWYLNLVSSHTTEWAHA